MRKYLVWFVMGLLVFSSIHSGCGGSSSSGGGSTTEQGNGGTGQQEQQNNGNTGQQETVNQSQDVTPNNPTTEYTFSILSGEWSALNGTGQATGPDGNFDLRMVYARASFSNIQIDGSTTSAVTSASAQWDAYQNGTYIRTIPLNYSNETIEIQRISANIWRYTFPSLQSRITVTIRSATTADVIEEGNFGLGSYVYQYRASYTITKQ